jgi:hypothetical protein
MCFSYEGVGQDTAPENVPPRPVRSTFESSLLIDNQTVMVPFKGTFQWDIQHRFGTWDNGYDDYFGLAAPSNIRLGFNYIPVEKLQIGFGITKERKMWDFSAKYAIVQQKRSGGSAFSITYYGVIGIDSRDFDGFEEASDNFSYFNQIMIARKFSDRLSLQVAPSFSYFNYQERINDDQGAFLGTMGNKHVALTALGRIKVTDTMSFIGNVDIPLTEHEYNDPATNVSLGIEFTSSSHAFQLFVGNYQSINPQLNNLLNQNRFGDGEILIGFNITRLWNF